MKRQFPLMSLLLIPIGIALNFVIGSIASQLKLPIFLDSVGTILTAVLGGPIVGAVTGFLGVLSISAFQPSAVVWSIQAGIIGLLAGLLARFGWFRGIRRIIVSTLIIVVASVTLSATISYLVFGGYDGYGLGVIRGVLVESGVSLPVAIILTSAVAELIDKSISVAVPMIVIGLMSDRFLNKFSNGSHLREYGRTPSSGSAAPDVVVDRGTAPTRSVTTPVVTEDAAVVETSAEPGSTPRAGGYGSYEDDATTPEPGTPRRAGGYGRYGDEDA